MFKKFNFMQFLSQAQALVFSSGSGTPDYSTKQQRGSDSKIGKQSFEGFPVLHESSGSAKVETVVKNMS